MLSCGAGERWPLALPGVALPGVSTRRVRRRFKPIPPRVSPSSSAVCEEGGRVRALHWLSGDSQAQQTDIGYVRHANSKAWLGSSTSVAPAQRAPTCQVSVLHVIIVSQIQI